MASEQQVAWLGLGNMGRGMVKNLVEKGNLAKPLIIQNRTRGRSDKLAEELGKDKVVVVSDVQEAVQKSDIIFTCVGDDAAIRETFSKVASIDITSKLFIECSTVLPDTTNELAELVEGKGASFVASPVFGAPAVAQAGQLLFVLAGPKKSVDVAVPFTTGVMGKAYLHVSDSDYGKASKLKIIGNSMIMSIIEGLAEGMTLAEKADAGVDNFVSFIEALFPGPIAAYSKRMQSGDYHKREEPLFAVDLARKDARHMLALAKQYEAKMGNVENIDRHFVEVQRQQGSQGDIAGAYGAARVDAGLAYAN